MIVQGMQARDTLSSRRVHPAALIIWAFLLLVKDQAILANLAGRAIGTAVLTLVLKVLGCALKISLLKVL